jgi:23S rRNA (guanosine2251-2'-O)-methyltransferase
MALDNLDFDFIIGSHSILAAVQNPRRTLYRLVGTKEGLDELKKRVPGLVWPISPEVVSAHVLQEEAKKVYQQLDLEYHRLPGAVFLLASRLHLEDPGPLFARLDAGESLKIFCLDQVTDIHNAAAILRTAAFFGMDYLLLAQKGNFSLTPSFFRIAAGAAEYVTLVRTLSLPRTLRKLMDRQVAVYAFSEHAAVDEISWDGQRSLCLVLGSEEHGIGHAVERVVVHQVRLTARGPIKSLNVSVAAALAMEKAYAASSRCTIHP